MIESMLLGFGRQLGCPMKMRQGKDHKRISVFAVKSMTSLRCKHVPKHAVEPLAKLVQLDNIRLLRFACLSP